MRLIKFLLILGVSVLASASCDESVPATAPTPDRPPPKLVWDVSQNNRLERIGWPAEIRTDVWSVAGPGVVHLKIRGGVEHDIKFHDIVVGRNDARIKTIRVIMEAGTIDTVYADAMQLAADWRITKVADLQAFKDTRAYKMNHGGDDLYYAGGGNELVQGRSIEIRDSFDSASGKPYLALLAMGFKPDYDNATTQPSP